MKGFKVAVIGAGLMGGGIIQTCARTRYKMINIDFYAPALDKARSSIEKLFDRKIAEGTITEKEKAETMDKLTYNCNFDGVKGTGIVVEAVPEKMEIKKDMFREVDELVDSDTIIVSNAFALSISEIASITGRADKVMGVHFFYPAFVMKLTELIWGIITSDNTYGKVGAFATDIKKEVVDYSELPDFVVNRILMPMMNEATFLVMEGCKPEDVDGVMKLGTNHPMGPLESCDFVGVDVTPTTITGLYNDLKDSKYRPCPILENMVEVGHLGRKTGQEFYQYI